MSKKSQFGMTLLLSTILVGAANASTVPSSSTFGATMVHSRVLFAKVW